MKKIFFACLLAFPIFSVAQDQPKNEIGIGVGSVVYNTSKTKLDSKYRWTFYTPFSHSYLLVNHNSIWGWPDTYFNTVSPVVYYSREISKRFTASISYQFISIYGYSSVPQVWYDGPTILAYTVSSKAHNVNIGLSYTFIKSKHIDAYVGISGGGQFGKMREYGYASAYYSWGGAYPDERFNQTNVIHSSSIQSILGIKIPVFKAFNLKYEMSGLYNTDSEDMNFSPINRLSVNYAF